MKVGIVGLGLIGGSFAKAYHAAGWEVLAADIDRQMLDFAMLQGAVNGELTEDELKAAEKSIQDVTDKYIKQVDELTAAKNKEIMSI